MSPSQIVCVCACAWHVTARVGSNLVVLGYLVHVMLIPEKHGGRSLPDCVLVLGT
jgi:hypothetical protein